VVGVVAGPELGGGGEGQRSTRWVDAAPLPLGGGEMAQEGERLRPAPREGGERLAGIIAPVLTILDPSLGLAGRVGGLVHVEDRLGEVEEVLLGIPQMAHDLLRAPGVGGRPPRGGGGGGVSDGGGARARGAAQ